MFKQDDLVIVCKDTPYERRAYFSHYEENMGNKTLLAVFSFGATSKTAKFNSVKGRYEFYNRCDLVEQSVITVINETETKE